MPSKAPSPEVLNYFENKGIKSSYNWKDVFEKEHAFNFTVAKATELDILQALKKDLSSAIKEGLSFTQYQKNAEERLKQLGWWGKQTKIDPLTGEKKIVQLGSKRRLKTIFNTNMRTANAAGKWQRIQRTKKALPYLQYKLGAVSTKHRDEHLVYENKVLPVDDAFWVTHYPPNGFGCKCYVLQLTESRAKAIGISKSPKRTYKEVINPRTGKIERKYKGVGLGFASNAGMERDTTLSNFLNNKVESLSKTSANTIIKDAIKSKTFATHYLQENKQDNLFLPVALITGDVLKSKLKINTKNNVSVRFSGYTASKGITKHKDIKQEDYLLVQEMVDNQEFVKDRKDNHWISYIDYDEEYKLKAIFKRTTKNEIYLQTLFKILKGRK